MILRRLLSAMSSSYSPSILKITPLGHGPMPTVDPFLFCVYHKDQYPPGNDQMEAPFVGNGSDFNPDAPFRMYHGMHIPGFPQHPHRGFETITATLDDTIVDHADSVGNAGRYGKGDVQWMTAGRGVVHSEMFPLLETEKENANRFFQIWLNLPSRSKMVEPGFAMFWAPDVPIYHDNEKKARVILWSGNNYFHVAENNKPPLDSWATDPENDVCVWHITLEPGGALELPPAHKKESVNRSLFYIEGDEQQMYIDGQAIDSRVVIQVRADSTIELRYNAESTSRPGEFLLLQGRPIQEPVQQHGPFVMNTAAEIRQAFEDYSLTQFGGWPWPRDDMVFPRDKERFALVQGTESVPRSKQTCAVNEQEEK